MGGVHCGAEITMDFPSDLEEIAVRNVIVVCLGAKSILDLNLTMEYLETKSVPVYMAIENGIKLPCRMDSVDEVAKAYQIKNALNIQTGMILRNLYGKEYEDYSKRVNRCIPWFPKKR